EGRTGCLLDDAERALPEPAAGAGRLKRPAAEPLAIRRVGEKQREGLHSANLAEPCRITPEYLRAPLQPECFDILADQPTPFGGFLHKETEGIAARQRFQ